MWQWWQPPGLRVWLRDRSGNELCPIDDLTWSEKLRMFAWNQCLPTWVRLRWLRTGKSCWFLCSADQRLYGGCGHARRAR